MPSELLCPLCLGITRRRTSWPVVACQGEIYPQDNALSRSLAGAGAEHSQDLSKLSGAAFDKAYAQNELAYHVFVTGALETTLIPSTQNSQVKSLLQSRLALFEQHRNEAHNLQASSGNSGEGVHCSGASGCPEEQGPDWVANGSGQAAKNACRSHKAWRERSAAAGRAGAHPASRNSSARLRSHYRIMGTI
jgi:Domain of unknown function (DUF4142)